METSFRVRIIKLLNLTTSPNDHEALSASRMANEIIKKNGLTWDTFLFDSKEQEPQKPQPKTTNFTPEETVEEMISFIREYAWDDFDFSFVDSVDEQYESTGRLTYRQAKGLRNIYEKILEFTEEGN